MAWWPYKGIEMGIPIVCFWAYVAWWTDRA